MWHFNDLFGTTINHGEIQLHGFMELRRLSGLRKAITIQDIPLVNFRQMQHLRLHVCSCSWCRYYNWKNIVVETIVHSLKWAGE